MKLPHEAQNAADTTAPGHLVLTHPYTLGVFLAISLWHQRTGGSGSRTRDLLASVLATTAVAGVAWLIARLITPDARRRSLLALLVVCWCLLFGSAQIWMVGLLGEAFGSAPRSLALWTLLVGTAGLLVMRARSDFARISRALGAAGYALVIVGIVNIGRAEGGGSAPSAPWNDARTETRPDVYLLVLDKYTSGAWLAANYGLDHAPMEDSLRALGFVVPNGAHANYAHTRLSLTSLLEGSLLDRATLGAGRADYDALTQRIRDAAIWETMASRGYRIAFFPSTYEGTRAVSRASLVMTPPIVQATALAESFFVNSPFAASGLFLCVWRDCAPRSAAPYELEPWSTLQWKLRAFASLPDSGGPIFAFLHLLSPHEPYLFSDDCSLREPWWPLTDQPPTIDDSVRAAYAAQVRCLDRELLATLTALRAKAPNAVIIATGDHGNGRFAVDVLRGITQEYEQLSAEQVGERFGVFAAVRFPGAQQLVPENVPLAHLLPLMRNSVFGESLSLSPDSIFWSTYQRSLDFTVVEKSRLAPPAASVRRRAPQD